MATYVERSETGAVGVKCLIVEIDELLSDSVDVCHGFSAGGSEGVTGAWQCWQRASGRSVWLDFLGSAGRSLKLEYSDFLSPPSPLNAPQIIRTMSLVIFQMLLRKRKQAAAPASTLVVLYTWCLPACTYHLGLGHHNHYHDRPPSSFPLLLLYFCDIFHK
jgi:hypothetical protein